MSEHTMDIGLLMETARAHQEAAECSLKRLESHAQRLDDIVREEIRRTLVDELQALSDECRRAVAAVRCARRATDRRAALWTIGTTGLSSVLALGIAWWVLPSRPQIEALRVRRDELGVALANLERQGARLDMRRCGEAARLCVRIDRSEPAYGAAADYLIVKGY